MKKFFVTTLSFVVFLSCGTRNATGLREVALNDLSKIYPAVSVDMGAIVRTKEFIPLASGGENPVVGEVVLLKETKDFFFILTNDGKLSRVDKEGNFLVTIGTYGRGPNEYLTLVDFDVDDETETVYVLDYMGQKIVQYGYDGNFKNSWPVPQNTYPKSIFLDNGAVVYLSMYNSLFPEINRYDPTDGKTTIISKPERTMGEEGLIKTTYTFGGTDRRHIYQYFNDTVYLYKDNRLVPDYILKLSPYNGVMEDLFVENLGKSSNEPRIRFDNIVEVGKYTFATYRIEGFREGEKDPMSFWSSDLKTAYPNVVFIDPEDAALNIDAQSLIFPGYDGRSIVSAMNAYELVESDLPFKAGESDNAVLVRYILK